MEVLLLAEYLICDADFLAVGAAELNLVWLEVLVALQVQARVDRDVHLAVFEWVRWIFPPGCLSDLFLFDVGLLNVRNLGGLPRSHELLQVQLISLRHLGRLPHARLVWSEIRILAHDAASFLALFGLIWHLVL